MTQQQPTDHFYGYFTDANGQEWLIAQTGTGFRIELDRDGETKLFIEDHYAAYRALQRYQDALDTDHKLWTDSLDDQDAFLQGTGRM